MITTHSLARPIALFDLPNGRFDHITSAPLQPSAISSGAQYSEIEPMSVRENLIAAKALIDTPEKWGREEYTPNPGCFCVIGALCEAMALSPATIEAESAEARALALALPEGWERNGWYLPNFNDDPTTTHVDIMALFDRAIAAQDEAA